MQLLRSSLTLHSFSPSPPLPSPPPSIPVQQAIQLPEFDDPVRREVVEGMRCPEDFIEAWRVWQVLLVLHECAAKYV